MENMAELWFDIGEKTAFSPEKLKKVALCESERLLFDLYCLEPGQAQKPHAHAGADKVYFVLEGEGESQVGAERRRLGPGHAVLAPADIDHGVLNPGPERLTVLVFMAPNPNVE